LADLSLLGRDIFANDAEFFLPQLAQHIDSVCLRDTCLRALSKKVQFEDDASTPTTGRLRGNYSRRPSRHLTEGPFAPPSSPKVPLTVNPPAHRLRNLQ
jgi:hypothetical protein